MRLKLFTLFLFLSIPFCIQLGNAQTTVTLKLSSNDNEALIWSHPSWTTTPRPDYPSYEATAWTWNGVFGIMRSLMQFDLSSIPTNATIVKATLDLYNDPTCSENGGQHSSLSGSNAAVLQRITSSWNENSVTWNNQPTTTTQNQVFLAQSISAHQDYINIDVKNVVIDMVQNASTSFGFMFQLNTEVKYRDMIFGSGANADSTKRPVLKITYVMAGTTCLTIKLDSSSTYGQDAIIWNHPSYINTNYGNYPSYEATAWTWSSVFGVIRSLMEFNLSSIPSNATILSANLDLYNDPTCSENGGQQSSLTGSNAAVLKRIINPWNESTVTWNNQPATTTQNQVPLAQSTSIHQDYLNIDVTNIVTDMFLNPSSSFGFMFELDTELTYRDMIFASGDNLDTARHPVLRICYSIPNHPVSNFQSSGTTFCSEAGACVNFSDQSTGSPTSWTWLFPGASPDTSSQQNPLNICYTQPGTYSVTLITSNSNGYDTLTISPMITIVQPPPPPTVTLLSGDTLICSYAYSYQWYYNGSPVFGANDSFIVANSTGTYAVQITDSLGCSLISNGYFFTSTNQLTEGNGMVVYPNPSNGEFIVYGLQFPVGSISISNVLGEIVYSANYEGTQKTISCKLPTGIYFLEIKNKEEHFITKIMVQ